MSIADELNSIETAISVAYSAIEARGGTLPENKNLANMVASIESIPKGPYTPPNPPGGDEPLTAAQLTALQEIIGNGEASETYNLGDNFLVSYGSYVMPFMIIGFEDVELEDGTQVPAINLMSTKTDKTDLMWDPTSVKTRIYSTSNLRNTIVGEYQSTLDPAFVACLGAVRVDTLNRDGTTDTVYDKLYAPSAQNFGSTDTMANSAAQAAVEGPVYQGAVDNVSTLLNPHTIDTDAGYGFWLRTYHNGYKTDIDCGKNGHIEENPWYEGGCGVMAICNLIGGV